MQALLKDGLGWGFALWLVGYVLGIVFFFVIPIALIGWVVAPIGAVLTLLVLARHVQRGTLGRYAIVAVAWTVIAVVFDYLFIVQLLQPDDGYYKLDVYLYYALTFILPLFFGLRAASTPR